MDALLNLIQFHPYAFYPLLILLCPIIGPLLAIAAGLLVHSGALPLIPIFAALMAGDLIGDTVWYLIGYFVGTPFIRKVGPVFSITQERVAAIDKIFHRYKTPILFISKVTTGFGFSMVTLFTAGLVKIPFRAYIFMNVLGQFVWTGILLAVGYYFGDLYDHINFVWGKFMLVAIVIAIGFALFGLGSYIHKRIISRS